MFRIARLIRLVRSAKGLRTLLYHWNPFTYYLDVVRAPVVFSTVPLHSWAMAGAMSGVLWIVAILLLLLVVVLVVLLVLASLVLTCILLRHDASRRGLCRAIVCAAK